MLAKRCQEIDQEIMAALAVLPNGEPADKLNAGAEA
jgi:hypothetical protein